MKQFNPHISVDCVVFGFDSETLNVLLVKRPRANHTVSVDKYKLPGDLVFEDENLDMAAGRVLSDLTGLNDIFLRQFHVFGDPERIRNKPDDLKWLQETSHLSINRVVTVAYYSLISLDKNKKINSMMNANAEWYDVRDLPDLAFDHSEIVQEGISTIKRELQYEPLEFELLPKKFTIRQLQTLYEVLFDIQLDNRNFRKKLNALGYIVQLEEKEKEVAHKPANFFRFDKKKYKKAKQDNQVYSL